MMAAVALGALMMLFLYLGLSARPATSPAEERLARLGEEKVHHAAKPEEERTTRQALLDAIREGLSAFVSMLGRRRGGESEAYKSVRQRLLEAGFRAPNALSVYMGSRIVLAVGLSGLSLLTSTAIGKPASLLTLMLPAMIGYLLPGVVVDRARKRRQESIERGLADAIDLMLICIEAGLGLRETLGRVGEELKDREPVIANEFRAAVAEASAGRGLLRALRSMADRTANKELDTLVSLLIQTDRFGTPLTETLRMQGESIRFARMQRAEEAAQKAPVKMLGPSMLIFMAILIIVGGPALISIRGAMGGAG